ncbi:MAG: hypothetical protein AMXMBFR84_44010 [Candidatus Hydrogenedentota bacterium]
MHYKHWSIPCLLLMGLLEAVAPSSAQDVFVVPTPEKPAATVGEASPNGAYASGTELYVSATALALRKQPSNDATRIHYIPQGDKVVVLPDGHDPLPVEFEGIKGHWLHVKHGYHSGYVFDGFLTANKPAIAPMPETANPSMDFICTPGKAVGEVNATSSLANLQIRFGADNVQETEIHLGEGFFEPGTAIFPGKPEELKIRWDVYGEKPASVIIEHPDSPWKTPKGIGVGTPLKTLVTLNNAPVKFLGFGWDYAGGITSWGGGSLEKDHVLGSGINLTLNPQPGTNEDALMKLSGDSEFTSAQAGELDIRVSKMIIQLGNEESSPDGGSEKMDTIRYATGTKLYVFASELNVRSAPDTAAAIVAEVPYGTELISKDDGKPLSLATAQNMQGYWLPVEASGKPGYVFSPYVLPIPTPKLDIRSLQDYAQKHGFDSENTNQLGNESRTSSSATFTQDSNRNTLTINNISMEQAFSFAKRIGNGINDIGFIKPTRGVIAIKQPDGHILHIRQGTGNTVHIDEVK